MQRSAHDVPSEVQDPQLVQERRRQFVAAAIELFRLKGYNGTTVREIARAAGVSVGLLYLYFRSKEDILALACQEFVQDFTAAVQLAVDPAERPAERLRQAFTLLIAVVDQASDLHLVVYREMPSLPLDARRFITQKELDLVQHFQAILDAGVTSGHFRAHDTRLRAHSLVMLGHMWALKRWALRSTLTGQQFAARQIDDCLAGIEAAQAAGAPAESSAAG